MKLCCIVKRMVEFGFEFTEPRSIGACKLISLVLSFGWSWTKEICETDSHADDLNVTLL